MGWHIGSRDSCFGSINIGFLLKFTYVLLVPDSLISKPVWYLEWVQEKTRMLRFQLCQVHLGEEGGLVQVTQCRFLFPSHMCHTKPRKGDGTPLGALALCGCIWFCYRWDAPQEPLDPPHKNLRWIQKHMTKSNGPEIAQFENRCVSFLFASSSVSLWWDRCPDYQHGFEGEHQRTD